MWLLLRLVTVIWEFGSGRITVPTVWEFLAWTSLPFGCSGPLLRFFEFRRQAPWSTEPPQLGRNWWIGLSVGVGMVCGGIVLSVIAGQLEHLGSAGKLMGLFGTSPWGWYLSVGGQFALCRSAGILAGIIFPISFDRPLFARNISDFWARWNMTATAVFRETLFFNRWGFRAVNLYINSIVLFLIVGIWHAVNGYWVLWGLLHGIGFAIFIAYKRTRVASARHLPAVVSWAFTYLFVCFCWAAPPQVLMRIPKQATIAPATEENHGNER
jgi:D-alanyl-lipoteichoic acid acyltransferase DltB (MBOAT superfamily)